MEKEQLSLSLDIGSRSLKGVAFDGGGAPICQTCQPLKGQLKNCLKGLLESFVEGLPKHDAVLTAITGANSGFYAGIFGLTPVNGILSTALGATRSVPEAGAVLEIGGEHANFIRLFPGAGEDLVLRDFFVNSACSSGTGSFLEQEAHRLGLTLERLGRLAVASRQRIRVAGRCAVFAKTDIVHLHQNGVPLEDIASALCASVAQNIAAELVKNREFRSPLVFVGGVAANSGIRNALLEALRLDPCSLTVPPDHVFCGATGAYLYAARQGVTGAWSLQDALKRVGHESEMLPPKTSFFVPLCLSAPSRSKSGFEGCGGKREARAATGYYLGIDVGSTATKVICLDDSLNVQAKVALPTRAQALRSVFQGLSSISARWAGVPCRGLGITGSGRHFVAALIGADVILDEISAHAVGGRHLCPEVDTIFDIGGQDSKFIRVQDGTVAHFAMNKVCSAGTGSFLEEMAGLLGLDVELEFAVEAACSTNPVVLGERCTVFIGTEIARRLQEGEKRADLAAGLCYAVVHNYLARVVGQNKIGRFISFQGGVAGNRAVVSALENVLHKPVHVPSHHEMAGALGVALLAAERKIERSRFRGLENLDLRKIETSSFECRTCANNCRIQSTKDPEGNCFHSGGLCDRHDGPHHAADRSGTESLDLFAEREKLLNRFVKVADPSAAPARLGLPRALHFHELLPLWSVFFNELGVDYRVSDPTTRETVRKGTWISPTNPCLPIKTGYGHCLDLRDKGVTKIFIPSIPNCSFLTAPERLNHVCTAAQAWPFTARALFSERVDFLTPTVRLGIPGFLKSDIVSLGRSLGFSGRRTLSAFQSALQAQRDYYADCQDLGRRHISGPAEGGIRAVLLSRPYTICDRLLWLPLRKIFADLNILPFPLDMVPSREKASGELEGMYWYYGKRFLQVVDALTDRPDVVFIHLSNFGCGADSFILHFLRQWLKHRPALEVEIDEHIQLTGLRTRLEAFAFSLRTNTRRKEPVPVARAKVPTVPPRATAGTFGGTKLLIPQMSVHAFAFEAAFRAYGVRAEVLPLPDQASISYGKGAVGGGECLPCPFVLGDMLRYARDHGAETPPPAFLMISGDGPCRLGQYPFLQRLALDEGGFEKIPIFDASQDQKFYERFGMLPASFKRRVWQGVVATDLLFRKWREGRSYAVDKERFDVLYAEELRQLLECITKNGNLARQLRSAVARLDESGGGGRRQKPVVAVLGENYVRCNPVANGRIADRLEELGAEVWFPSLYEWVLYGNWTARLHCLYDRQYRRYLQISLINAVQRWDEYRLARPLRGQIRNCDEPSVREIIRLSGRYVPKTFEGETLIEVARTLDFHRKRVCGVIRVVPFGCIMGTIVETLSERISRDLAGFPIMTIAYDGQEDVSQRDRLEAFMMRARIWQGKERRR